MTITTAAEENIDAINALIARSKAHWDWSPEYLAAALALTFVDPAYLRSHLCFELRDDRSLVGFMSVTEESGNRVLDNLWIDPERIGQGYGRQACEHAFDLARCRGWPSIAVIPDPPAEGFYLRMGFADTGRRVPSRVPGGPTFSVFGKEIKSDQNF